MSQVATKTRKATACNATAPGVTQVTRYANAKTGSTARAILIPRKKSLIERAYRLAEACGLPLWNQDEAHASGVCGSKWSSGGGSFCKRWGQATRAL